MKRILFALAMVGCLLSFVQKTNAATDVSLNLFYDNLSPYGSWIDVGDYGYCFQPNVAANDPAWRPYSDGYWAYTDVGWTWVSYEDFGWATYHYGRWANLDDFGWVWVPGYDWGPAWVSWRTGGDYIGWAPLPPTRERIYEGRPISGQVDVEFDIGPLYYNFVDIRYVGEPVLRERLIAPEQNVTIINRTVNVTNITYNNTTVYNYGPDISRVNQFSTRPVQRLTIQRETNVSAGIQGGQGNLNRVNGNQFVVVAPQIRRSAQTSAPKQVKTKVQQAKVEHGWKGISNREQLQAQMKNENPKAVPPPTFQPQQGTKANAGDAAQPNEPKEKTGQAAANREARTNERAGQAEGNRRPQKPENGTQPNESNEQTGQAAANAKARANDRAHQAEQNRRQNPEENANPSASQSENGNQQAQRTPRPGVRRPAGAQDQASADRDREQRNVGSNFQSDSPNQRANQPEQAAHRQQAAQPTGQHDRPRNQRPEASPENSRAGQNQPGNEDERTNPRQRAQQQQRPPQREENQEARPGQQPGQSNGQEDQNGEHKGKKKKPNEPQPTP